MSFIELKNVCKMQLQILIWQLTKKNLLLLLDHPDVVSQRHFV